MKSLSAIWIISLFVTSCLLVCSLPVTETSETGLALRSSGEIAEYFDQHELVKRVPTAVWTATLTLLGVFAAASCNAAFSNAGLSVPADIACAIFGIASLGYAAYGHMKGAVTRRRTLEISDGTPNRIYDYVHLFPEHVEFGRPLDQMQASYNGSERILVSYHPCTTNGCYNVFYDNHYDVDGDLVHHLALEPRGTWHLEKRQHGNGNQVNQGVEVHTDNGTPFFADYAFYDWTASVEHTITSGGSAKATKKTFLEGSYNDKSDLAHAGYFCQNWSDQRDTVAGTKGVYWQSEKTHMADPDALPAREAKCKKYVDPN